MGSSNDYPSEEDDIATENIALKQGGGKNTCS